MFTRRARGVSPVIATVILSAVVVTIGGVLWSFSQSATTIIANDYAEGVMDLIEMASERFTVEYVSNSIDGSTLHVWIYNYGPVNVTMDVYTYVGNSTYSTDLNAPVAVGSGDTVCANVTVSVSSGDEVAIKAHSRRQNNAYSTYIVP